MVSAQYRWSVKGDNLPYIINKGKNVHIMEILVKIENWSEILEAFISSRCQFICQVRPRSRCDVQGMLEEV